jgi:signal transduction histidine kinase
MQEHDLNRFEILRGLAVAGSQGESLRTSSEPALRQTCQMMGLEAASLYVWNDKHEISFEIAHAKSEDARKRLTALETDLFAVLRDRRQLVSAYMTFGGESGYQAFTLPLHHGPKIFGAVIGLAPTGIRLVSEDLFLEALSASMSLNALVDGLSRDISASRDLIDKERLAAIIETAVTVNHEVNNPLTAILGNVQLLLLKRNDLDPELQNKLRTIEASAIKIKDVTQKLLRLTSARSVKYTEGTNMLDLSDEP